MSVHFNPFAGGFISTRYPLTKVQKEIWLAIQLGGDEANAAYNESVSINFDSLLDEKLIYQSLSELINRHEALRGTVSRDGNDLCIMNSIDLVLEKHDLTGQKESADRLIDEIIECDMRKPFSLENGPLIRAMFFLLPKQRCCLVINAHHIVCDGWSSGVVLTELSKQYTALVYGFDSDLSEAPSYQEYALRDKEKEYQSDLNYWLNKYQSPPEDLDFPADFPRPVHRTFDADRVDLCIDAELTKSLRNLSRQLKTTFFTLSYAAFCAYISRIAKTNDFSIGVPYAGQLSSGLTGLVGHCVNILPFRVCAESEVPFSEFMTSITNEMGDGFEHADLSFGSLLEELAIARDSSRVPLIPITFNLDKDIGELFFGANKAAISTNIRRYEPFDLAMNLVDRGDDLLAEWSFNTNLFSRDSMLQRAKAFKLFLQAIVDSPSLELAKLPITSDEEIEQLQLWNQTSRDVDDLLAIPQWFNQTATNHPNKIAIEFGDETLTYHEAQIKINSIALALKQQNVTENSLVGLFLERSSDLPLCMLAVMQIGCAYVPLDPAQPIDRLSHIVEDADMACMLSNVELPEALTVLVKQDIKLDSLKINSDEQVHNESIALKRLAYVIYTSGSTGKPKGVAIPHLGLSNIVRSFQKSPGFSIDDKLLAITTAAFDIAALELFLPLVTGATLCIASEKTAQDPQKLNQLLHRHQITLLQCVPTTWRLLLSYGGDWCGGEALPNDLASMAVSSLNGFWNVYGPTETTIWSTVYQVPDAESIDSKKAVSIGSPIDNTSIYILDENKQRLPIGVPGMLWIGGAGVADGYNNRPELTTTSFQANPYSDESKVIYNTGDIARLLPEGNLEYLGRQDFQVKIRGFRIELGDIESILLTHDSVHACVVHADVDADNTAVLLAYIEAVNSDVLDINLLREYLTSKLPAYMVPSQFVTIDKLPINSNGKVDRAKLPKIGQLKLSDHLSSMQPLSKNYVAPKDDLELIVAKHFQDSLGIVKFGMLDNFFESGGNSLSAVRLVIKLNESLDLTLPLAVLLHSPTPKELVDKIKMDGGSSSIESVVRLRTQEGGLPVFCLMGINIYASLAESLGEGFDIYALLGKKENDFLQNMFSHNDIDSANTLDITGLANEYTDLILSTKTDGPCHLLGFSSGGVVAIEVAKRLQEKGKHVEFVGLLDTMLPRAMMRTTTQWLKHQVKDVAKKILENEKNESEDLLGKRGDLLWKSIEVWDKSDNEYKGNTALFRATDLSDFGNVQLKAGLGWEDVLLDEFPIINVPGNHANLLEPENAKVIAGKLKDVLLSNRQ